MKIINLLGDNERRYTEEEVLKKTKNLKEQLEEQLVKKNILPDIVLTKNVDDWMGIDFIAENPSNFHIDCWIMREFIGDLKRIDDEKIMSYINSDYMILLSVKEDRRIHVSFYQRGGLTDHGIKVAFSLYFTWNAKDIPRKIPKPRKKSSHKSDSLEDSLENSSFDQSGCVNRIDPEKIDVTFEDVAGIDDVKQEATEIVDFLKNPERFTRLGAKIPKGLLLSGEPGTGKTMLARAMAKEAGVPFFHMNGSAFDEQLVGVGAARVRALFKAGKDAEVAVIIFIDELDAIGKKRGLMIGSGSDRTLNQLLVEMDGFEVTKYPIIVIAATNRPDILDGALTRPGRFDRKIHLNLPDRKGREAILAVHTKNLTLADNLDINRIARGTPGFSGATLANLSNEAALFAGRQNADSIEMEHFQEAIDKICLGVANVSRVIPKEELRCTAIHEAGHAICAIFEEASRKALNKISIISRGETAGVAHYFPQEYIHHTKESLNAELVLDLGGRAAEEVSLGKISSGAVSDIKSATIIARKMITEWGMSDEFGTVSLGYQKDSFSGQVIEGDLGNETLQKVDAEVSKLVNDARAKAKKTLEERKEILEALADKLLEKETIDADVVYDLILEICNEGDVKIVEEKRALSASVKL